MTTLPTLGDSIVIKVPSVLQKLIPSYLSNRQEDLQKLDDALDSEDFEAARLIGHSLKGSGGSYGFHDITTIGQAIEEAAQETDPDMIRHGMEILSTYLERVDVQFA